MNMTGVMRENISMKSESEKFDDQTRRHFYADLSPVVGSEQGGVKTCSCHTE